MHRLFFGADDNENLWVYIEKPEGAEKIEEGAYYYVNISGVKILAKAVHMRINELGMFVGYFHNLEDKEHYIMMLEGDRVSDKLPKEEFALIEELIDKVADETKNFYVLRDELLKEYDRFKRKKEETKQQILTIRSKIAEQKDIVKNLENDLNAMIFGEGSIDNKKSKKELVDEICDEIEEYFDLRLSLSDSYNQFKSFKQETEEEINSLKGQLWQHKEVVRGLKDRIIKLRRKNRKYNI